MRESDTSILGGPICAGASSEFFHQFTPVASPYQLTVSSCGGAAWSAAIFPCTPHASTGFFSVGRLLLNRSLLVLLYFHQCTHIREGHKRRIKLMDCKFCDLKAVTVIRPMPPRSLKGRLTAWRVVLNWRVCCFSRGVQMKVKKALRSDYI